MALTAVKGHAKSQRMFTALLQATEKERKAEHDSLLETAIEYKTEWEGELERRRALGIVGPDPNPHPDDVIINVKTGEVHITGPVTKQEKVKWDRLRNRKHECLVEIRELKELQKEMPDNKFIQSNLSNDSTKTFQRSFQIERQSFVTLSEIACDGHFTSRYHAAPGRLAAYRPCKRDAKQDWPSGLSGHVAK